MSSGKFVLENATADYAPDLELEPIHLEIRLEFDLKKSLAWGCVETTVEARRADASEICLDAVNLDIEKVLDEDDQALEYRYDGEKLRIKWSSAFEQWDQTSFSVHYKIQNPITGMLFSYPNEAYPARPKFVATDHETERARYWLPCVDKPVVRTKLDFYLTAPKDYHILANGQLMSEEAEGDKKCAHWQLSQPCPSYLICLAAGEFTRFDDRPVDGLPISYFATKNSTQDELEKSFGRTPEMMEWLEKRLGIPFPYPKYFQFALPNIGGAMENISLVSWEEYFVLKASQMGEWQQLVDSINLHEMAHSYFGDMLVCRHFEHSWLKESWAVYMETVYWEETIGRDQRDYDLYKNAQAYFSESDNQYARPIVTRTYDSSWNLFDHHLYPGGAWRIHMLRMLIGDNHFWQATEDYLRSFADKTVETDDFRRKLEEFSGHSLVRFFDEWIYQAGYPQLKLQYSYDSKSSCMNLLVEQSQVDSKKSISTFSFDLELEIESAGKTEIVRIPVNSAKTHWSYVTKSEPSRICVDPDMKLLHKLDFSPGYELLKNSLASKRFGERVWAAKALIKGASLQNFDLVKKAMEQESFYGLRAEVAKALGSSGHPAAIGILAAMLEREEDQRIQVEIAGACGAMRDESLRKALKSFLEKDLGPRTRSRAILSLAAQKNKNDIEFIEAECVADSAYDIVNQSALLALGQLGGQKSYEFLKAKIVAGELPEAARDGAVNGLASCYGELNDHNKDQCRELLIDLCRDSQAAVRMAAGNALAKCGGAGSANALEGLKSLHAAQEAPRIERMIRRAASAGPVSEAKSLRKELDKVISKNLKLEERLSKLEARAEAAFEKGGAEK